MHLIGSYSSFQVKQNVDNNSSVQPTIITPTFNSILRVISRVPGKNLAAIK